MHSGLVPTVSSAGSNISVPVWSRSCYCCHWHHLTEPEMTHSVEGLQAGARSGLDYTIPTGSEARDREQLPRHTQGRAQLIAQGGLRLQKPGSFLIPPWTLFLNSFVSTVAVFWKGGGLQFQISPRFSSKNLCATQLPFKDFKVLYTKSLALIKSGVFVAFLTNLCSTHSSDYDLQHKTLCSIVYKERWCPVFRYACTTPIVFAGIVWGSWGQNWT